MKVFKEPLPPVERFFAYSLGLGASFLLMACVGSVGDSAVTKVVATVIFLAICVPAWLIYDEEFGFGDDSLLMTAVHYVLFAVLSVLLLFNYACLIGPLPMLVFGSDMETSGELVSLMAENTCLGVLMILLVIGCSLAVVYAMGNRKPYAEVLAMCFLALCMVTSLVVLSPVAVVPALWLVYFGRKYYMKRRQASVK